MVGRQTETNKGPCSVYDPPISYWCANKTQGGGAAEFVLPSGLKYTGKLPHAPYKSVAGAVLWAWRSVRAKTRAQ